jgi:hypothetical protein
MMVVEFRLCEGKHIRETFQNIASIKGCMIRETYTFPCLTDQKKMDVET